MAQQFYYIVYRDYCGKRAERRICAYNVSDAMCRVHAFEYQSGRKALYIRTTSGRIVSVW